MNYCHVLRIFMLVLLTNGGVLGAPLTNRKEVVTQDHPIKNPPMIDREKVYEFLTTYGYMRQGITKSSAGYADKEKEALASVQKFFKLNITGELDSQTVEILVAPRCSVPDITIDQSGRQKRKDSNSRWASKSLTYLVQNLPTHHRFIDENDILTTIDEAIQLWTEHSAITITKSPSPTADIKLGFYKFDHGDDSPFDGPDGNLAHAYLPPNGAIHLDDGDGWQKSEYDYTLKQVVAHEAGHALGLDHTNTLSSIMYPKYQHYLKDIKLGADDIAGIQSLYGPNTVTQIPTTEVDPDLFWEWFWRQFRRWWSRYQE